MLVRTRARPRNCLPICAILTRMKPARSLAFVTITCLLPLVVLLLQTQPAQAEDAPAVNGSRRLVVDDYFAFGYVSDPQISPDGEWIAYTVFSYDLDEDSSSSQIWMVPADGGQTIPLTAEGKSSSTPRWSPEGDYLAFLSARDDEASQVWLLNRLGGEATQVTSVPQGIGASVWNYGEVADAGSFEWSPDGKRLVLVIKDPDESDGQETPTGGKAGEKDEEKTPPPWVITRRQFKLDVDGYMDERRTHLYVLDLATKDLQQVTFGSFDDMDPAWSSDGKSIAFVSNRSADPDSDYNTDIWVIAADNSDPETQPTRVSANQGHDGAPAWSPDGKWIAYSSTTDEAALFYATAHLAVAPAPGAPESVEGSRLLTKSLDRNILSPEFTPDGNSILFLLEDQGTQQLAKIPVEGGDIKRVVDGSRVVTAFDTNAQGQIALSINEPYRPTEIYLLSGDRALRRTEVNDGLLEKIDLGTMEKIAVPSPDGVPFETFVIKPPGFVEGQRYPTVLSIHGGPQSQYDARFYFEEQWFAANGYLVVMPNPRGSTGYGQEFCYAIWQDWGGPDFDDVMAAVDRTIDLGWADPNRLAVTGWSYGGMLTDIVITKTDRFQAAATGASSALYVINYGHDQYQRWWEYEFGLPWEEESRQLWERLSPFNQIDRVVTPTLILGGEKDWNVPIINSEQLFMALKRLGVDTELIVYPNEHHSISTPSYRKDLMERYVAWFDKYLKGVGDGRPHSESESPGTQHGIQ